MKKALKTILNLPFILLNSIKVKERSLFWRVSSNILNDKDKIVLSRKPLFTSVISKAPDKGLKIISFLNSLSANNDTAKRFSQNLLDNLNQYESQLGQDCIVDTLFQNKTGGIFVEIGVGEGKHISNTYFLEKYRNWSGLLCEPATKFHDSIRRLRTAQLVTNAVLDKTGEELNFIEVSGTEELSTLARYQSEDSHNRQNANEYKVTTISFNDLYAKYLPNKKIDYLSVDTEGSEETILGAIDFKNIDISVISVEHNYNNEKIKNVRSLLEKFGYVEVLPGVFEFDTVYAKKDLYKS